jgi:hypothetical protein
MKPSTFLRKTAEYLYKQHSNAASGKQYSCCEAMLFFCCEGDEISHGVYTLKISWSGYISAKKYFKIMRPKDIGSLAYWWGDPAKTPFTNERVLALLFAAELAESEGN